MNKTVYVGQAKKKKFKILVDLTYMIFYWRVLCFVFFFCGNVFLYHAKSPNRGLVTCMSKVTQDATFLRQSHLQWKRECGQITLV